MFHHMDLGLNEMFASQDYTQPNIHPSNYPSVEIFTFNICFRDNLMKSTLPRLTMTPIRTLLLSYRFLEAYIQQLTNEKYYTLIVSFMWLVNFKYLSTLLSFPQSYPSGCLTHGIRNKTSVRISIMYLELINNNCTTEW